ncbi:hypothetical protein BSL78_17839 [Apostichopus japonicus]|uniref:Uncharacterized protein n=1 Tax=Stichopus japonicus TaxID=307972 RepID=A0A2G8KBE7_STIJA|nr:hypothetical protein BSL78_17839 [Apostichopus japonicus]
MAAKIVDQMKEKMKLAGQTALLAEMIPKREGALDVEPQMRSLLTPIAPSDMIPGQQQDGLDAHRDLQFAKKTLLDILLELIFKPYHSFVTKKIKKAVTVKQLKDELRQQATRGKGCCSSPFCCSKLRETARAKETIEDEEETEEDGVEHVESFRKKKTIRPILRDGKPQRQLLLECHKESCMVLCRACPRVYHRECIPRWISTLRTARPGSVQNVK